MNSTAPAPIGVVAHYNLLERLDPAGPGDLYRARDTRRGRTVAVRLLPPDFVDGQKGREELIERALAVTSLSHPNVITLFDAGEHEGRVYLAFEFVKGQSLRAEMAGRPMNVRRAVETAIQIADAIADAHAAGFVHGGLSSDSVMMTATGHAKVPAFALATRVGFEHGDGEVRLRDYDSPEEARGSLADDRSDIYSVGAILFEMLTTRQPLHRGSAAPSAANAHVPAELDDVVLKAVAPNPDSRFQNAATFAAALRGMNAVLDARGVGDEEYQPERSTSVGRIFAIAAVILAVLALVYWWMTRS